jgi:DNA-binding MarR family transcriptional regulator
MIKKIAGPVHLRLPVRRELTLQAGHELGMYLRKAYLTLHRRANAWMLSQGVTADQYVLLSVVAREPGITQISIVDRTASDPNTVAAILRRLEQRGLIRREAHARDRRARCVFLTAEGQRIHKRAAKHVAPLLATLQKCRADFDADQVEGFLQGVHRVFSAPITGINGQSPGRDSARKTAT